MSVQEHTVMRLYVGGLPYQTTDQELMTLFQQAGRVTMATVITDRATGRSKGFGFVQMDDEQESKSVITQLNGSTMEERTLTVNQAHERQSTNSRNTRY